MLGGVCCTAAGPEGDAILMDMAMLRMESGLDDGGDEMYPAPSGDLEPRSEWGLGSPSMPSARASYSGGVHESVRLVIDDADKGELIMLLGCGAGVRAALPINVHCCFVITKMVVVEWFMYGGSTVVHSKGLNAG